MFTLLIFFSFYLSLMKYHDLQAEIISLKVSVQITKENWRIIVI